MEKSGGKKELKGRNEEDKEKDKKIRRKRGNETK